MAVLVTRAGKGAELTFAEVDGNWTAINADLASKQTALVSGTNIKTVGGVSLLGAGDIPSGGGATNLTYDAATRTVASDTGTDAVLTVADITNAGLMTAANFTKLAAVTGTNTGDQTTIAGITGTKAQFNTAVSDGDILYVGDAPTAHTHLLAAGATDVTVTAANLNALDDGLNTALHFHDADRARGVHTGTQLAATVSDFSTAADARIGAASINALADVIITTPAAGQVIKFNGTNWINDTDATVGGGLSDGDKGDITVSMVGTAWNIDAGVVTLAKQADMATGSLVYRKTAAAGAPEIQTLATLKTDLGLTGTNSGDQTITLTGNVTGTGTGSFATTIANSAVTNAMMANMAAGTIKGNATAGVGAPVDYAPYGLLYAIGSTIGVPVASQAQAEAGTTNTDAMTPLRTKQAIDANLGVDIAMRNNIFLN